MMKAYTPLGRAKSSNHHVSSGPGKKGNVASQRLRTVSMRALVRVLAVVAAVSAAVSIWHVWTVANTATTPLPEHQRQRQLHLAGGLTAPGAQVFPG